MSRTGQTPGSRGPPAASPAPRICSHGHPRLTDRPPAARARGAAAPRRRCAARAVERPAPVGIPARALAGPAMAVGLHRLDGHAGGHARRGRAVRRQPLLGAGRGRARRQRHRAREDPHRRRDAPHRLAGAPNCRAADGRGRRPGAGAGRRTAAARARSTRPASRCAPTSTCWTRPGPSARRCRTQPVYEHLAPHAPQSRADKLAAGARGDGARTARRTTSSRPSTTSRGSPTCAAPTSTTTRCSWRTC